MKELNLSARKLIIPVAHQIRVHLQYLGHPIANDQVYSETRIWVCSDSRLLRVAETYLVKSGQGDNLGKGGVDLTPSDERSAPLPPSELPESSDRLTRSDAVSRANGGKLLPRETGHDIGMGSPVPLSKEAVEIITRLRNLKVRGYPPSHLYCVGVLTSPFRMKTKTGAAGGMSSSKPRVHWHRGT